MHVSRRTINVKSGCRNQSHLVSDKGGVYGTGLPACMTAYDKSRTDVSTYKAASPTDVSTYKAASHTDVSTYKAACARAWTAHVLHGAKVRQRSRRARY